MKKILNRILALAVMFMSASALVGCNDDPKNPDVNPSATLAAPTPTLENATAYTLTFSWTPVNGAVQYAYELLDIDGESMGGGTGIVRTAYFEGLKHGTSYTFRVWALGQAFGDNANSSAAALEVSTKLVQKLSTPQNLVAEVTNMRATITWDPVENAEYYVYSYTDGNGKEGYGTVYDSKFSVTGMSKNEYTFTVYACSDDELWDPSDVAEVTFKRN